LGNKVDIVRYISKYMADFVYSVLYIKEVIAKLPGTRAPHPQILEKCGQDARVPGKTAGFKITSKLLIISGEPGRNFVK